MWQRVKIQSLKKWCNHQNIPQCCGHTESYVTYGSYAMCVMHATFAISCNHTVRYAMFAMYAM